MNLAPGVEEFLALQADQPAIPWATLTPDQASEYLARARQQRPSLPTQSEDTAARTEEMTTTAGIPVRVYRPETRGPLLVYFHGGGWVMGDLDLNDAFCRTLGAQSGFVVVSVDYRLAPEYPFPTPLADAYATTCWVAEHAGDLGAASPPALAVMGTSAGGNLAAAVAIKSRESGRPMVGCQVLIYACLDDSLETPSFADYASGYFLEREQMRWYWRQYLPEADDHSSPLAVPARLSDPSGLPPAVVITAECDPLRDEGADYAQRLAQAGVTVRYHCYPGQIHGFLGQPDLIPGARSATIEIGRWIREVLTDATTG